MSKTGFFQCRVQCRVVFALLALVAVVTLMSSIAPAQEPAPRVDVFLGYSWLDPNGRVATAPAAPGTTLATAPTTKLKSITKGWDAAATWNFNKWVGLEGDVGGHYSDPANITTVMFGPKLSFRSEHFTPFIHALAGFSRISPANLSSHTGFAGAAGGGLDLWFTHRIAVRVFQADFLYQAYRVKDIGPGGSFNGARVQGGLVFGLGSLQPPVAPAAACSVQPTAVLAGEPITANVNTQNFNPKHTLSYDWKATGGKVTPNNQAATIDTTGLNPGSYTVTATVNDPKGPKNYNVASCNTGFTINEPPKHPPTISCSANPTTVRSGDSSTVSAQANSPDNRPLTYQWRSTGGRVTGTGATGTLDTAGAPAGPITVTCTVSDDRGLTAASTATVNVEVPPPPPQASKIGEIAFPNKLKPGRVDNTAKAILDDVALRLQREPDAKAVIVGYFDPAEKGGITLAQQRAVNTKAYLATEKGIDPNRVEVRTGTAGGNRAEVYLVPAGATFNVPSTQTFNEAAVSKPAAKAPARRRPGRVPRTAPATPPRP